MTRKHFQAIAITIGYRMRDYAPNSREWTAIADTATALCHDFRAANSGFDRDKFMEFVLDVAAGRRDLDGKKVAA